MSCTLVSSYPVDQSTVIVKGGRICRFQIGYIESRKVIFVPKATVWVYVIAALEYKCANYGGKDMEVGDFALP